MVKCLAQGHEHHGHGQDFKQHSDDSAIRTQNCSAVALHGRGRYSKGNVVKSTHENVTLLHYVVSEKKINYTYFLRINSNRTVFDLSYLHILLLRLKKLFKKYK